MPPDLKIIRRTKGFLEEAEGEHLYRLAREAAVLGPCLEIGSYCGKSTVWIGTACREAGQVLFAVDHHRGSEEQQPGEEYFDPALFDPAAGRIDTFRHFRTTLADAGLEDTVVPIVCRSELAARAWKTPLSLVFIDGGHALDTVAADSRLWSEPLMPGGLLVFHDIFPDPSQGGQAPYQVYREALAGGRFAEHSLVRSLGVLQVKKTEWAKRIGQRA
ncbi:MAG: class I SAM-dependent methyltransferase [Desulfobacteraceae bacterium]|nr:MAG: class I SAM-dependent methyltransferase [Desulfobacteraceae bacterium]